MLLRRKRALVGLFVVAVLVPGALAFGLWQMFASGGGEVSPWLFCTTNPCQPLALFALPTPPALTHDRSLAARCDFSAPGARDGVLLWYTDWDPRTQQGRCVSREDADKLTGG
jgi:hypothetical protein